MQFGRPGFDPCIGKIPWRKQWQLTPILFLSGEFHGQRSLASYSPWGHKESDTTKQLTHSHTKFNYSQSDFQNEYAKMKFKYLETQNRLKNNNAHIIVFI